MAEIDFRLAQYLNDKIDTDNALMVEAVERYVNLLKLFNDMQEVIDDEGPSVVVQTTTGSTVKSHPLISDMKNINAQLINLKKDIDKHILEHAEELKAKADEYDAGQLL
jgi:hypothetical protein